MKKLLQILAFVALAGLLQPSAAHAARKEKSTNSVETGSKKRKERKKKGTSDQERKPTPYEKLFQNKQVESVHGGGLALHYVEDKLYLELPDSLLDEGWMVTTSIERTGDPGDGIAGQHPVKPYLIEFCRGNSDSLIYLREYAPAVSVEGSPAMRRAIAQNYMGAIVGSYAVKARTPDGNAAIVDLTPLFVGDEKRIRPIDPEGGNTYGGWMTAKADYKKDRSKLLGVSASRQSVSVLSELSYGTTVSFLGLLDIFKDKPQSIVTRRTITRMGPAETRKRLCDQRIGTTYRSVRSYSDREQGSEPEYFTCRRSLTDSAGNLRPIVFYVDTTFDARTYAAIERGLLMWNDAFARIGHADVIRVKPIPSDPGFNDGLLRANCVRRTGTSNSELYAASWIDRRSGEILGSEILVPFNYAAAIRSQLLLTMSAADPAFRSVRPSEERIAEVLTALIARHAATTLGISPNHAASAAYPTDSLRSAAFTRANGFSASITDDVYCNIVAQEGDKKRGVKLIADALGPYDYLAVEWLYRPVPGAATPKAEIPVLDSLLARHEGDPRYFFALAGASLYDPRVGNNDLGDDLFRSAEYQIDNLKYVAAHADEWLSKSDGDYKYREELLIGMIQRIIGISEQLLRYVGGLYMSPAYEGLHDPFCSVVPKQTQRQALQATLQLSETVEWIDNQSITKNVFNRVKACTYLQERILRNVLAKLGSLDLAVSRSDDPYTTEMMAADLTDYFREKIHSREPMSRHLCEMQQTLLRTVISAAKVQDKESKSSASAFALTDSEQTPGESFAGGLLPASGRVLGADEIAGAPYGFQRPQVTVPYKEHLFYGLLLNLQTMYRRGASQAPLSETRDFCRYMADRIDRALKIK